MSLYVDINEPELYTHFEENAPQLQGITQEVYRRPGKEYLQESLELCTQVDNKKSIKQVDLHKMLKIIQRKACKGKH